MTRFRPAAAIAATLGCAAIPAALLHQALAATAGTLFEAAPFVLAVTLLRGRLVRPAAALFGCGCGPAAGPAALSLPATALCWATFGAPVALARFGAAALIHVLRPSRARPDAEDPDPLRTLGGIIVPAFALALATTLARDPLFPSGLGRLPPLLGIVLESAAGALAGTLAPCSTSAVALAAMLRTAAPFAAAGMLATAGLTPHIRLPARRPHASHDSRFGLVLLAIACGTLALRGGSGFVHPRLVALLWIALSAALFAAIRHRVTRTRFGALAPAAMLAALAVGSPPPATPADASLPGDWYAGEALEFEGIVTAAKSPIVLARYAITCCRADATAIEVPTDLRVRAAAATWLAIDGTVARDGRGLFVHVTAWRRIAAPTDPYLYR